MSIAAERKQALIQEHARGEGDTGSPEVQGMYPMCDAGNETGFPHTSIHKHPLTHVQLHY